MFSPLYRIWAAATEVSRLAVDPGGSCNLLAVRVVGVPDSGAWLRSTLQRTSIRNPTLGDHPKRANGDHLAGRCAGPDFISFTPDSRVQGATGTPVWQAGVLTEAPLGRSP